MPPGRPLPRRLIKAAEDNPREFFRSMMKDEYRSTSRADWIISGIPMAFFNPVLRTDFPEAAGREIRRMIARFEAAHSPISWSVGPLDKPRDLGDQLLANGFRLEESVPVMVMEPVDPKRRQSRPEDLVIRPVADLDELAEWSDIWFDAFEIPAVAHEPLRGSFIRKASERDPDVINYSGLMGGRLVAIATLFLGKSAAGIYNIATVASARGRGVGTAMTRFVLADSRRRGYKTATLQSSKAGYEIYRGLGFKECFKLSSYVRSE
jgi:ribosomal protein S18 acetylase RimI-like enzyme